MRWAHEVIDVPQEHLKPVEAGPLQSRRSCEIIVHHCAVVTVEYELALDQRERIRREREGMKQMNLQERVDTCHDRHKRLVITLASVPSLLHIIPLFMH